MLVIISDLHLTDGTSGQTVKRGAFRIFAERLQELARDASTRKDGKYKPIQRIDLVLLGDILDVIRSTTWNQPTCQVRPWDDSRERQFIDQVQYVTDRILAHNRESLDVLKSLNSGILIASSETPGQPSRVAVPVRIFYLVGNHDWFYHLPDARFDAIRRRIIDAIGLANSPNTPFPHDPQHCPDLVASYKQHRVFARHGDIFDPDNYENGTRDGSSIGDAIVIELINKFTLLIQSDPQLSQSCKEALREIDNVRPLTMIPAWVYGTIQKRCGRYGHRVVQAWRQVARDFLRVRFVKRHHLLLNPLRDVSKLAWGLKLSRVLPLKIISAVAVHASGDRDRPSYRDTRTEKWLETGDAQYIVYGHTHRQLIIPLRAIADGETAHQIYFNSGTWRPVHELAQLQENQQQFVGYHVMTYLAFFDGDEFHGRGFDSWSGTLDTE